MSHANGTNGKSSFDGSLPPGVVSVGTLGDRQVVLKRAAAPAARATTSDDLERELEALPIVEAQHADDRENEAAAARARADAENAVDEAKRQCDAALARSAEKFDDNDLADAAARSQVRLQHARSALAGAMKAHEEAKAQSVRSETALEAKRHAAAILEELRALDVQGMRAEVDGLLETVVRQIAELGDAVLAVRQVVEKAAARARRIQEMGGPAVAIPDATFAAGIVARVAHELGGGLIRGANVNELRWPLEKKLAHPTWDKDGRVGARELVDVVFWLLKEGQDLTSRAQLRELAEVWCESLDRLTAERAVEARQRPGVDRRVAASVREQEAHRAKKDERRFAGFALKADGSPVGFCHVCGKGLGTDAVVDRPEEGPPTLRHPDCFGSPAAWEDGEYQVEQVVLTAPPAPPRPRGHWDEDGSYSVDGDHTKPPTVG